MAGNGDRLKPLLRPTPRRGPQRQGARPGSPALKRRAIERIEYLSTCSVDDHKRLAIRLNLKLAPFGPDPIDAQAAAGDSLAGRAIFFKP